jgi:hypothetical protein
LRFNFSNFFPTHTKRKLGILNYKWSQTGLLDGPDRVIAGLLTSLLLGFGAKYFQAGDKGTGTLLAVIGALQGLGAKGAAGL